MWARLPGGPRSRRPALPTCSTPPGSPIRERSKSSGSARPGTGLRTRRLRTRRGRGSRAGRAATPHAGRAQPPGGTYVSAVEDLDVEPVVRVAAEVREAAVAARRPVRRGRAQRARDQAGGSDQGAPRPAIDRSPHQEPPRCAVSVLMTLIGTPNRKPIITPQSRRTACGPNEALAHRDRSGAAPALGEPSRAHQQQPVPARGLQAPQLLGGHPPPERLQRATPRRQSAHIDLRCAKRDEPAVLLHLASTSLTPVRAARRRRSAMPLACTSAPAGSVSSSSRRLGGQLLGQELLDVAMRVAPSGRDHARASVSMDGLAAAGGHAGARPRGRPALTASCSTARSTSQPASCSRSVSALA